MQSMRWRDVDSFSIDCFYFSTFFGGSGTEWAPIKTEYIDFDEFIISTTPITHEISNFGPIITQFPDNVQYIEGQLENTINWSATDSDPDKYNIYQDDLIIYTGSWLLDVPIIISVDGLNVGNYSYKIEFFDSEGHSTIDEVIVSIIPNTGIPDVNNDGNVNIVDALLISQYYVGESLENFDPTYADCDKNGQINIVDALMIAQYYVGTRPQWW